MFYPDVPHHFVVVGVEIAKRTVFGELKNKRFISTLLALACKYNNYPLTNAVSISIENVPASSCRRFCLVLVTANV